jgi:hypothetical protein
MGSKARHLLIKTASPRETRVVGGAIAKHAACFFLNVKVLFFPLAWEKNRDAVNV